jgi:hypothetical protein
MVTPTFIERKMLNKALIVNRYSNPMTMSFYKPLKRFWQQAIIDGICLNRQID